MTPRGMIVRIRMCRPYIIMPYFSYKLNLFIHEQIGYNFEQAFGAPTIVVHTKEGPELFFGSDRFPLIAQLLKEVWKGPFPEQKNSKL
jgi:hypothetical protein